MWKRLRGIPDRERGGGAGIDERHYDSNIFTLDAVKYSHALILNVCMMVIWL